MIALFSALILLITTVMGTIIYLSRNTTSDCQCCEYCLDHEGEVENPVL